MSSLRRYLQLIAFVLYRITLWLSVGALFLWAAGALWFLEFLAFPLQVILAAGFLFAGLFLLYRIKPKRRWLLPAVGAVLLVYCLTLFQQPSNNRSWADDNAMLSSVRVDDNVVNVHGYRHSRYRSETDFDVNYGTLQFPLEQLDRVWFVVQRFTALEGIAHNFLTFRYLDGSVPRYFSVSVEIRREQGESFSPIRGLYRQYELIYVVADETDQIGARTVMRPDDRVYMYPVNANAQQVQLLFLDIVERIQQLETRPEYYHSLLNNCTNSIVLHTYRLTPSPINWLDPRIVAPGFADRLAYSHKLIGRDGQSFRQLRTQCRIDTLARQVGISPTFSSDIRRQLPAADVPE